MKVTKWRLAKAEDLPALNEIHRRQWAKTHLEMDYPPILEWPTLMAVVGENSDGEIVGMAAFEAIAELWVVADDPRFVRDFLAAGPDALKALRFRGIRMVRSFPITRFSRSLGWLLEKFGFTKLTNAEHWHLRVPGEHDGQDAAGTATAEAARAVAGN